MSLSIEHIIAMTLNEAQITTFLSYDVKSLLIKNELLYVRAFLFRSSSNKYQI